MRFLLRIFDARRCHAPSQITLASLEKTWRSSCIYLGILYCQITHSFWNLHEARFSHLCFSCGSFHTKSDTIGNQKDSQITIIETCIATSSWHLHCPVYTKKMSWYKEGDGRSKKPSKIYFFSANWTFVQITPVKSLREASLWELEVSPEPQNLKLRLVSPLVSQTSPKIAQPRPHPQSQGKYHLQFHAVGQKLRANHPICLRFLQGGHFVAADIFWTSNFSAPSKKIHQDVQDKVLGRVFFLYKKLEVCIFQEAQNTMGKNMEKPCHFQNLSNREIPLLVALETFYPNPNQEYYYDNVHRNLD